MNRLHAAVSLAVAALLSLHANAQTPPIGAEVLANAPADAWRSPDPARTVYLDLPAGRVVIELASDFAPAHAANISTLAHNGYWDGLSILRAQDNYVVQWGDANAGTAQARPLAPARGKLPAEFDRSAAGQPFTALSDGDIYAPQVGWSDGFPVGRDPASGRIWLAHCYGMVGAGRDAAADSSNGAELYAVIGHAPRHLDRNIAVVGRVVQGIEWLSALPRGSASMGFYAEPEQRIALHSIRLAADLPAAERVDLDILRTDTKTWNTWVESRRNRQESWFKRAAGFADLCNIPVPVRAHPAR